MIINAVNVGDHGMNPKTIVYDLQKVCTDDYNAFVLRLGLEEYALSMFADIARFAKEHKKYFAYLYAYQFSPKGKESHLNKEVVAVTKEIAGEYFLGEIFGEAGSDKGAKSKGYFVENPEFEAMNMPPQTFENLTQAKDFYVQYIQNMAKYNHSVGVQNNSIVEATAFMKYNLLGGMDTLILEMLPANPEILIPFARGASRGLKNGKWGSYIANEWYGGYRHEDNLKKKRLDLAYRTAYMDGSDFFALESGFSEIDSFGVKKGYNSSECKQYRRSVKKFVNLLKTDVRPEGGPLVKVGFLHGNLDGYTCFMGSSIWSQFDKEEWGIGDAEYSWKILDELSHGLDWHDFINFADTNGFDCSRFLPYGTYDVVPIESPLSVLEKYDMLVFVGWNTMTEDIYERLKKYVQGGGHLVGTMAHFDKSDVRDKRCGLVGTDKDREEFFGFETIGQFRTNEGVKFVTVGINEYEYFAGAGDYNSDCNFTGAYSNYAFVRPTTAKMGAFFDDKFDYDNKGPQNERGFFLQNRYGKGTVSMMTNIDYPAKNGVYEKYRVVVRSLIAALNRKTDIKVVANERVRYRVYKNGNGYAVYLLNTDFDCSATAKIVVKGKIYAKVTISPTQLKRVDVFTKER